ncbi:MAG: amino acid adenylation domain-containing protein, partial [Ginsengibacter sp.]
KAGAAYVPIDTDFPADRINFILKDTKAAFVVSSKLASSKLSTEIGIEIIDIDAIRGASEKKPIKVKPSQLAYVIYTSGSTGMPKGVMIEHRSLVDYVNGLIEKVQLNDCASFALVSTIATDLGNTVIYGSLATGGALHVFTKESVSNIEYLHNYFSKNKIDCLKIVPSHWKVLNMDGKLLLPEKLLVFGGEALQAKVINEIVASGTHCRIVNHYGPTETTIGKLLHIVEVGAKYEYTVPIGKPFSNTKVLILNNNLKLCPKGVAGQLYITGDGIARGYLNNEELTKEKFIPNPFSKETHAVMYSTGDLVKYLPDGNVSFIGRVDNQVKVRGYRIELGEIESILIQCPLVSQAAVLAKEDKQENKRLVGYIIPDGSFDREGIISYLEEKLPDYMIPAVLIEMESFPLTPNGKIDRNALPDPDVNEGLKDQYVAPRNEVEAQLAEIWQDVLELDEVGVTNDFFELGGHSLLAVRLVSAIRKTFSVEMPIGDIFDYPTVELLAGQLAKNSDKNLLPAIEAVRSRPQFIPLSYSQERLWFIDRLEGSVAYHVPTVLRLKGSTNVNALEGALKDVINRHEVLRTVILEKDGHPYQHIKEQGKWQLSIIDGASYSSDLTSLRHFIIKLVTTPFDLAADDMLRAHLITLGDSENILVVTMHHIASDGWSKSVLVRELLELYKGYDEGHTIELSPLAIQYADYAIWQKKYLNEDTLHERLSYWKEKLHDVKVLSLPTDYPRPAIQSTAGASVGFNFSKEMSASIQEFSLKNGCTLFMTLLAAFKVLLYRYSNQHDICVGTAVAGRQQKELEDLIGFFVNTLALRSEVKGDLTFDELLLQVKSTTLKAYEFQDIPFEKVVDAVIGGRNLSTDPLVQIMFALQNTPDVASLSLKNVELSGEIFANETAKFDLFLSLWEHDGCLQGGIQYCTDLYAKETIERMCDHYQKLLESIVNLSSEKIGKLPMLTKAEERQFKVFEDAKAKPLYQSIVHLFEEQVDKTPQAIALEFINESLTYKELNERSNKLAHFLQSKAVKQEMLVAICIERSVDMMVSILGILKAGGAYVPIDPGYPAERIKYMLEDTGVNIIISSKNSKPALPDIAGIEVIAIDESWDKINSEPADNLSLSLTGDNLAYIIYTSGSTGKPKGVMVEHGNVVSLVAEVDYVSFTEKDILLSTGSSSFDATTFEYWGMLLNGGRLVLCPENTLLDNELLKKEITGRLVTKMWFTSSWFNQLVEYDISVFETLQTILVGGEKLSEQHIQKIRQKYPDLEIINGYGPTENTTFSLTYNIKETSSNEAIPIGYPLNNRTAYILNEFGQTIPVGVPGELLLGGAGLARGYLNRPELTAERFIPNPFNANTKLYRTGDLCKWLPNGAVSYIRRLDDQVKLRGYRIELGEVEAAMNKLEQVNNSCVIFKKDIGSADKLIAYYIPDTEIVKEKERELYSRLIASWKELYETEYAKTATEEIANPEFNIIGWNDTFTGLPIPAEQMEIWLHDITDVIMAEKPRRVLEIGTGTGLIYYQLAGKLERYIGTDFSRSSMNQVSDRIAKGLRDYGDTELQICAAHEVTLKDEEQVDTIVLNSIIQYFPGEDY